MEIGGEGDHEGAEGELVPGRVAVRLEVLRASRRDKAEQHIPAEEKITSNQSTQSSPFCFLCLT